MDPKFDMYDALVELWGVTDQKADQLAEEYPNLPTLSWAVWHDEEYIQSEIKINPSFLREQLYDAELYESYQRFPERVIRPGRASTDDTVLERILSPEQSRLEDYVNADDV